jgi:RNA polymerase sigma-70 factor (ECF subfamily)
VNRAEELRLLRQAQRGDGEAFAALYRAHVQAIYRYIAYRVNDSHLAEDLTADVFTKALQSLGRYEDQGKPFVAWLYRIARARVIDHYRRTDRRPVESDVEDEPLPIDPDMDAPMIRRQAAQALRAAIAELTDDQQQVIILRFVEGHRIETVAQLLGKQPNAIKALQHRALRALANRLERTGLDIESLLAGLS